jgi:hypothetical protein
MSKAATAAAYSNEPIKYPSLHVMDLAAEGKAETVFLDE